MILIDKQKVVGTFLILLLLSFHAQNLNAGEILNKLEKELSHLIEIAQPSVVSVSSTVTYSYQKTSKSSSLIFWEENLDKQETIKIQNIGSGLIIDSLGHIITKSNVVPHAERIEILLANNEKYEAEFIGCDYESGLAIIKITSPDLIPAQFGDPSEVRVGKWVAIMGNSIGVASSMSLGLINGIRQENDLIQLSAFINPGNSGSPIFNINGEVIGIVAARLNTGRINFGTNDGTQSFEGGIAYPVGLIQQVINRIFEQKKKKRAYWGIITQDADSTQGPVIIKSVAENSPAQRAGLKPNDILIKVNGQTIRNSQQLLNLGKRLEPGCQFTIVIKRDTKILEYPITLAEWPSPKNPFTSTMAPELNPLTSTFYVNRTEMNQEWHTLNDIDLLKTRIKILENEIKQLKQALQK